MIVRLGAPVYTFDVDFGGVVSNIVYLRWSEMWRVKVLEALGIPVEQMLAQGFMPVVARHEINYRKSLVLGDAIVLEGWVEGVGKSSVRLWMEVRRASDHALVCDNRQVIVLLDRSSARPVELPAEYRRRMLEFLPG